eukprot:gnl/TRDRNA2_/TRDRNA2_203374_c0_seq1.p1 gnl/TRDRNA2_/TRDRNA2_203374_c0~~gnl/TRDRNA2_/TRDRNA2_203374_c0_seq1.p1  ORF type:complete len:395 (+),score=36.06 gnl/TRDRNA2_/TRDRNA2_203374_c0_seq1:32-1216(+)
MSDTTCYMDSCRSRITFSLSSVMLLARVPCICSGGLRVITFVFLLASICFLLLFSSPPSGSNWDPAALTALKQLQPTRPRRVAQLWQPKQRLRIHPSSALPKLYGSKEMAVRSPYAEKMLHLSQKKLMATLLDLGTPTLHAKHRHNSTTAASVSAPVPATLSRREASSLFASTAAACLFGTLPSAAEPQSSAGPERKRLLEAIDSNAPDEVVLQAIDSILPLDPSKGRAGVSDALSGTWRLLWSYKTDKFSPLLSLPRPIRPTSLQLLGPPATSTVGEGRVANLLCFPLGGRVLLSSGVRPAPEGPTSNLEIFPPFRLELGTEGSAARWQIVEAGSDAEFRALNARDEDAQAAPRNRYAQQYLEVAGVPGDLRVSKVISGDPVIVGSVFVHVRV